MTTSIQRLATDQQQTMSPQEEMSINRKTIHELLELYLTNIGVGYIFQLYLYSTIIF